MKRETDGEGKKEQQQGTSNGSDAKRVKQEKDEKAKRGSSDWMGTHRHLQAAIASIDDRLLFLRLCEELDARGIRYEQVSVENPVGGHMLRLTDISSIAVRHNVECTDFFANMVHCNIRLAQPLPERSQLECTFVNPPLVPDFERSEQEVESDRRRTQTWVQPVGTPSSLSSRTRRDESNLMPQLGQVIAQNIEERLLTYCHVYIPVKQFSHAYNAHFRQFCCVRTFAYFKLSLAYGDQRDLLLVLAWRHQKYSLCFGQAPRVGGKAGNGQLATRRWNPHVLVSQPLCEKFNRDRDLVWLVNYLVNTHSSLTSVHRFVRTQMRSTKTAAQILGLEAAFPAELTSQLSAVDEHTVRLSYGPRMAMEFLLLQNNQVAVRDCSVGQRGGVSLADFWRAWTNRVQDLSASEEENGTAPQ